MLGILPSLTCASEGVMDPQQKELAVARQGVECCSFSSSSFILNLEEVCQGQVTMSNKQGRVERIVDRLQEVSLRGVIRRQEAQVLQGLLQYASGFFAGRALKHASHVLARVVDCRRFAL